MEYIQKLAAVRDIMDKNGIHAYIIPSSDPHISEYLPQRYKCIAWTSGFTGSAGTLVITKDFAGLWTDSRYFVQGNEQLANTGFELVKLKNQGTPEYIGWLAEKLPSGNTVGFDGQLLSAAIAQVVTRDLHSKGINVRGDLDLLNDIWPDRPALPTEPATLIAEEVSGQSTIEKLQSIRATMAQKNAKSHLISSLDDLAWTLNIRGKDVPCNPVVLGFLLITETTATFYVDLSKINASDEQALKAAGVTLQAYDEIFNSLRTLDVDSILLDFRKTCYSIFTSIPEQVQVIEGANPSTWLKGIKNAVEIGHTRQTMIKDGVALTKFFKWVEENVASERLNEINIADRLQHLRSELPGFVDISFDTIAGYKAHGALPHYKATEESNFTLLPEGLLLVDSGGQYTSGTTDITRVISLGNITQEEKEDYTLVLKAMIEGSTAIFPKGTRGYQIDAITRKPLWDTLRNYGHGTGHGVGFYLNVHEGPQVFNPAPNDISIEDGMITSIEPGLYREGKHGIRIENLVLSHAISESEFGEFKGFETLTICYIATDLVEKSILTENHIQWLNQYNQWVYEKLSPHLEAEESEWLLAKTAAI